MEMERKGIGCDKWLKRGGKVYLVIFLCCLLILVIFLTKRKSNDGVAVGADGTNDQMSFHRNDTLSPTSNIPNIVNYVWCHNNSFQFEHFLSVLSTWKVLRPTEIIIHTIHNIGTDDNIGWFDALISRVPVITIHKIPQNVSECCGVPYGVYLLEKNGGIFVSENTLINENIVSDLKENFTIGLTLYGDNVSFLAATKADMRLQEIAFLDMHSNLAQHVFENPVYCSKSNITHIFTVLDQTLCTEMKSLDPIVTVRSNTTLGSIVRGMLYDNTEPVRARSLLPGEIPKLVHMIWFGEKNMTFMMYLSIRSALTVLNPEKVIIHGDLKLSGVYFEKIIKHPKIELLRLELPEFIFGKKLQFVENKIEVAILKILLQYGGIYLDWNVISVQPVNDIMITGYDTIMNFGNYVKEIRNSVVMAKPDSHFLNYYLKLYTNDLEKRWSYNDMEILHKLSVMYPGTIYYQKNLQIICGNYPKDCNPLHKNTNRTIYATSNGDFDWQKDTYFVNFNGPLSLEYANETTLEEGCDFVAEVGRYIMKNPYEYEAISTD